MSSIKNNGIANFEFTGDESDNITSFNDIVNGVIYTYQDGNKFTYNYDRNGNITSILKNDSEIIISYEYDNFNQASYYGMSGQQSYHLFQVHGQQRE